MIESELNGVYALRFGGYDDAGKASYFLLGVGVFTLQDGKLTGEHHSSIMPLANGVSTAAQAIVPAVYALGGTCTAPAELPGVWSFSIDFRSETPGQQGMHGDFAFVPAAGGVLWIVSQTSTVASPSGPVNVGEMAMGEAVKVADLPPPASPA